MTCLEIINSFFHSSYKTPLQFQNQLSKIPESSLYKFIKSPSLNYFPRLQNRIVKHLEKRQGVASNFFNPLKPSKPIQDTKFTTETLKESYRKKAEQHEKNENFEQAFKYFQKAAELGDAESLYQIGLYFFEGVATQEDKKMAVKQFEAAANKNHEEACFRLGCCYDEGHGVEKNEETACQYFSKAANHPEAVFQLALLHLYGIKNDRKKGLEFLIQAASLGIEEALELLKNEKSSSLELNAKLATLFFEEGKKFEKNAQEDPLEQKKLYEEASLWFKKAALLNHLDAINTLGTYYLSGHGVEKDESRAARYFQAAADRDHEKSLFDLGRCYEKGIGVQSDDLKAVGFYQKAFGHKKAAYRLGQMYLTGKGVKKDSIKAFELFLKAASLGFEKAFHVLETLAIPATEFNQPLAKLYFEEAVFNLENEYLDKAFANFQKAANLNHLDAITSLGICYEQGKGTAIDKRRAFECFEKAAKEGHLDALFHLGRCYEEGIFVEKNPVGAAKYYQMLENHAEAAYRLGCCYLEGNGVSKNEGKAKQLLERSALQGCEQAENALRIFNQRKRNREYKLSQSKRMKSK